MKKLVIYVKYLCLFISFVYITKPITTYAQKGMAKAVKEKGTAIDSVLQMQERVFNNARAVNDYGTAIQSLHYLLAADARYVKYTDTLATMYLEAGNYASAFALSNILPQQLYIGRSQRRRRWCQTAVAGYIWLKNII